MKNILFLSSINILCKWPSFLKVYLISKAFIEVLLSLKIYKVENDRLKPIYLTRRSINYRPVKQLGPFLSTFFVLFYDFSFKKLFFLFLCILDDFFELNKLQKIQISFLISFFCSNKNTGFFALFYQLIKSFFKINAINILSGINGIELFQLISFLIFYREYKLATFLVPLFIYNLYPSDIFIGNGLLIYASIKLINRSPVFDIKTEVIDLVLWAPQLLNFCLSVFQILFQTCPRHRMPEVYYKQTIACIHQSTTYNEQAFACIHQSTTYNGQAFACIHQSTTYNEQAFACIHQSTTYNGQAFACIHQSTDYNEQAFACIQRSTSFFKNREDFDLELQSITLPSPHEIDKIYFKNIIIKASTHLDEKGVEKVNLTFLNLIIICFKIKTEVQLFLVFILIQSVCLGAAYLLISKFFHIFHFVFKYFKT
ncbi:UDP-N-acetylglucosamine--dolichyl-phosphate N-acetylglucosaminephosphotransferase [Cucumispora dikerogammari]|nr:UDP-N-acetylglucosamine--dolichyl-phosphate N-acetylglucosaminephosphotransferase [Cucumispora dikerogammari]